LYFTGTPLTLKTAFRALHSVSHKWFSIGLELDIPVSELTIIEKDRLGVVEQMRTMLNYWLNNATDPLPSWQILIDALKAATVGENSLVKDLEEIHCSPEDQSSLGEWEPIEAKCHKDDVFRRTVVTFSGLHAVIMETLANSCILILHNALLKVLSL